MIRAFIAIETPSSLKDSILQAQAMFRGYKDAKVTWTRPMGIHLTLKFLGEIEKRIIPRIVTSLSNCCVKFEPIRIATTTTGAFPNLNDPKVFWLGVSGGDELMRLRDEIEGEMNGMGFKPDKGKFSPHLTLGRVKSISKQSRITQAVSEYKFAEVGWVADKVLLMSSTLKPTGAEYQALAEFRFKEK